VPNEDLPLLKKAVTDGFPRRREDDMWLVLQEMHNHREHGAPKARILELVKEHGIHYQEVGRQLSHASSQTAHEFTKKVILDVF
jgi:hypothetical protein